MIVSIDEYTETEIEHARRVFWYLWHIHEIDPQEAHLPHLMRIISWETDLSLAEVKSACHMLLDLLFPNVLIDQDPYQYHLGFSDLYGGEEVWFEPRRRDEL